MCAVLLVFGIRSLQVIEHGDDGDHLTFERQLNIVDFDTLGSKGGLQLVEFVGGVVGGLHLLGQVDVEMGTFRFRERFLDVCCELQEVEGCVVDPIADTSVGSLMIALDVAVERTDSVA